jgi:hypothetical protein
MSRYRSRYRDGEDEPDSPRHGIWELLLDRLCPIRDELGRAADPRRYFHDDLLFLADEDLELEHVRALVRLCLEHDRGDRSWLQERRRQIAGERTRRERQIEDERETEWRNHQAWLRFQAENQRHPTPLRPGDGERGEAAG